VGIELGVRAAVKKFGTLSISLLALFATLFVTLFATLFVTVGTTAKASWQRAGSAAAPREKNTVLTFYKDVLPILQNKCQSCHRSGEPAPMPLVTYAQTRPWAGQIAAAVEMKMMPPWFADPRYGHFANDPSLSEEEIATIAAWEKAGAPAGDAHDAPAPRKWSAGWNIPRPDLVVKMPRPVAIPARGGCRWRSCGHRAPRMCTMRSSTSGLPIQSGCGMLRWEFRLRRRC
jgi:hypothetical protein